MSYPEFLIPAVLYFVFELLIPLLIFILSTFFIWYVQSKIVLRAYYRNILPKLKKNRITYWLVGGAAVASHELLGHALVGAVTGSEAELFARITPERSAVKIRARRSAWGYLSSILATLAPCFFPPLILITLSWLIFPTHILIRGYDLSSTLSSVSQNFLFILDVVFNSSLLLPSTILLFYLLPVISFTAGSSKADFRIVLRQTKRYWYFALFLFIVFALGLEGARTFLNLPTAASILHLLFGVILLSFLLVIVGILMGIILSSYLEILFRLPLLYQLLLPLSFPISYLFLIETRFRPLILPYEYFFLYTLLSSTILSFFIVYLSSLLKS